MKLKGSEAIIELLKQQGAGVVFGYPGAANAPIYRALAGSGIRHVLVRNEQGAAHSASGYARVTKAVGVCLATSGPGATNLITGIANAYSDSTPLVAITGQVERRLIGTDAFQEADMKGATAPFCKHNYLVEDASLLPQVFAEAFYIAKTGRPGPVLIDIPVDVQLAEFTYQPYELKTLRGYHPVTTPDKGALLQAAEAISSAKRPLLVAGGGVIGAGAQEKLAAFAKKWDIPVVTTLMGVGAMCYADELCLGILGSHGTPGANQAVSKADALVLCGCRVNERTIGNAAKIAQNAAIIHFDIDPAELGKNIRTRYPVVGDMGEILTGLNALVKKISKEDGWQAAALKKAPAKMPDGALVNPKKVIAALSQKTGGGAVVCGDVGQNQIWTANNYKVGPTGKLLLSGGLGCMGYSLPASVGAAIGAPDKTVIVTCGDGGFQMLMSELGTICQEKLAVKIILFHNGFLGMVREIQKNKYDKVYHGVSLAGSPDFLKIADAYGMPARRIASNGEIDAGLDFLLGKPGAALLECMVDPEEGTLN